ncbi:hypothetical protein D9758_016093 [Tetrapyrgos nigripes]|uniref:Retrotransposon gag domain-containing protein n=1 Tax=Tetrapyrgos nigripes TaxID=182062 RepID=A0A8H5CJZ2_9AGAR|nr:hypothetical protein D9758_016093 [Tetrapyrgos nigripes]
MYMLGPASAAVRQGRAEAFIQVYIPLPCRCILLNTSESDSDSTHTALAPPTVPQDSSSTPQFSPPSVSSASLPGSPTIVGASNSLPSKAEIPLHLHLLNSHYNIPLDLHPLLCLLLLLLITLLELHMLRHPHLASLMVNVLMAESGGPTGHAATYCQSLIDHGHLYGSSHFDTWREFKTELIKEFTPEDECTQASLTLEGVSYFQGTASVDEYINNFHALITMAGLNVEPILYSMNPTAPTIKARLEDAKHPALERKVAEAEAHPQEWDIMAWYSLAKRFDKHEWEDVIFRGAQRSVHPGPPKPTFPSRAQPQGRSLFPIQFPTPAAAPVPAPKLPFPKTLRGRACPDCQHEHVHVMDMSVDNWQEIAEAYAAFQDFQAALMNEPAQEDFAKDQE